MGVYMLLCYISNMVYYMHSLIAWSPLWLGASGSVMDSKSTTQLILYWCPINSLLNTHYKEQREGRREGGREGGRGKEGERGKEKFGMNSV